MRSFSHPTTHFRLLKSDTPPTVDGFAIGEPTGLVSCIECRESNHNVDEIPHKPMCSQRYIKSRWWVESMRADGGKS